MAHDGGHIHSQGDYIWRSSDDLGKGTYGEVYKCRNKKTGELAAIKIYKIQTASNDVEIDILKRLDHPNVVKVLNVEYRPSPALIMEYCSGKSLHHFLEEPCNFYGLNDESFILLLNDLVEGLKYLQSPGEFVDARIVHRDIKPMNILIGYREDARPIFKLSDFGTAKVIKMQQEDFGTLVGTPEYLQPDMFDHYTNVSNHVYRRGCFNAKGVDLWPLGLTLFYSACGHLPFQPFGSLSNPAVKNTMLKMISQKPMGVISGIQKTYGGEIEYSYCLPSYCRLSKHLQLLVVPLFVELMVNPPSNDFDLYSEVSRITQRRCVQYFIPHLFVLDRLYVKENASTDELIDDMCSENSEHFEDVQKKDLELWWKGLRIYQRLEVPTSSSVFESEPLMLISKQKLPSKKLQISSPYKPERLQSPAMMFAADQKYARRNCAIVLMMEDKARRLRNAQLLLSKHARYMDAFCTSLTQGLHDATKFHNQITIIVLEMFTRLVQVREALPASASLSQIDMLRQEIDSMCAQANESQRESDRIHDSIQRKSGWTDDNCCSFECEDQIKRWAECCLDIYNSYKTDFENYKKNPNGFPESDNDMALIHKISNHQLFEKANEAHTHIDTVCIPRVHRLQDVYESWSKGNCNSLESLYAAERKRDTLSKLQNDLQASIESFGKQLTDFITAKVGLRCNSKSKRNEIFERARHALEESSRTLENFQKCRK